MYTITRMATNVRLSDDTWRKVNRLKDPGDSFDEVIGEIAEAYEETEVSNT